jgi:hypothetical protein
LNRNWKPPACLAVLLGMQAVEPMLGAVCMVPSVALKIARCVARTGSARRIATAQRIRPADHLARQRLSPPLGLTAFTRYRWVWCATFVIDENGFTPRTRSARTQAVHRAGIAGREAGASSPTKPVCTSGAGATTATALHDVRKRPGLHDNAAAADAGYHEADMSDLSRTDAAHRARAARCGTGNRPSQEAACWMTAGIGSDDRRGIGVRGLRQVRRGRRTPAR